jgi:hypothetical protein
MKLLLAVNYLLKIKFLLVIMLCANKSFAVTKDYSLLDKPLIINYSVGNEKFQMSTYLASKRQRAHSLYLRIMRKVYDEQFLKYGLKLTPNEKDKISELLFDSYPANTTKKLEALKTTAEEYKDVCKISAFMGKESLTPNSAYTQYIKKHKTKLSKTQWEKLLIIYFIKNETENSFLNVETVFGLIKDN